jgi:hypothetical protein
MYQLDLNGTSDYNYYSGDAFPYLSEEQWVILEIAATAFAALTTVYIVNRYCFKPKLTAVPLPLPIPMFAPLPVAAAVPPLLAGNPTA